MLFLGGGDGGSNGSVRLVGEPYAGGGEEKRREEGRKCCAMLYGTFAKVSSFT